MIEKINREENCCVSIKLLQGYTQYTIPLEIQKSALESDLLANVGTSLSLSVSISYSWSISWFYSISF